MNLLKDIYLYYALLVLIVVFILYKINPNRIKELLPISIISLAVLFLSEEYLITTGLYQFTNALIPIFGVPLFHLIWGAGSGIIVMFFMPQKFVNKLFVILVFTFVTELFEYIPEHIDKAKHLGKFNEFHDFIQDFISLSLLVFFSEGFFSKRFNFNDKH
jgi:hypothetical protein